MLIDKENPGKVGLVTTYVANRFKPYTKHTFRVKACTRVGCATSEECATYTRESTPTGLKAPTVTAKDASSIAVAWEAPKETNGVITAYVYVCVCVCVCVCVYSDPPTAT